MKATDSDKASLSEVQGLAFVNLRSKRATVRLSQSCICIINKRTCTFHILD